MFKVIGIVVVISAIAFGAAHSTGHLRFSGDVDVTEKGLALVDEGIDGAQNLTNKGFEVLRSEKTAQAQAQPKK